MKLVMCVVLALGVGFAAAYTVVSNQKEAASKVERAKLEAQWQAQLDALEKQLAAAKQKQPVIQQVTTEVPVPSQRTPEEILENLLTLQPTGAARIRGIRKIVHDLEDLAELGNAAVPAIREFLARNSDLDYSTERGGERDGDRRGWTPPWQRNTPPTEFTLPPSLRIGLFDVLKDIGTAESEALLGEVLATSGRAVEVAYLARTLEEMAPGKYRETAISAAKDLLRNPIAMNSPNRLDQQSEGYLYGVLELYNDVSFVGDAKALLVTADGRLDRNAQQYLSKVQGENMVSTYYDLFAKSAFTNNFDRMSIASQILGYAGPNQQANAFLKETWENPELDARAKSFAVMSLAGGLPGTEPPTDPNVIRQRIPLIESLRASTTDERMVQVLDRTQQNLQNILEGKPTENPFDRFRGGSDGGRGRRDDAPRPN